MFAVNNVMGKRKSKNPFDHVHVTSEPEFFLREEGCELRARKNQKTGKIAGWYIYNPNEPDPAKRWVPVKEKAAKEMITKEVVIYQDSSNSLYDIYICE